MDLDCERITELHENAESGSFGTVVVNGRRESNHCKNFRLSRVIVSIIHVYEATCLDLAMNLNSLGSR